MNAILPKPLSIVIAGLREIPLWFAPSKLFQHTLKYLMCISAEIFSYYRQPILIKN